MYVLRKLRLLLLTLYLQLANCMCNRYTYSSRNSCIYKAARYCLKLIFYSLELSSAIIIFNFVELFAVQSGSGQPSPHASQENPNGAVLNETVLTAIATCKRLAIPHRVADASSVRELEHVKNDCIARFDKSQFYDSDDNQECSEVSPIN